MAVSMVTPRSSPGGSRQRDPSMPGRSRAREYRKVRPAGTRPDPALLAIAATLVLLCLAGTGVPSAAAALDSGVLPGYNYIFVSVANDGGAQYNIYNNDTYNIRFEGVDRGLNALHISTDPSVNFGQVTTTDSLSGTFYATDSGGKGYEDEILLMVAVNGTVPDNFRIRITSDGYTWTPNVASNTAPDLSTVTYREDALDETFTKEDFVYGPQTWKPTGNEVDYPIYYGQDLADTANTFRLMFVDLRSGVLRPNTALRNRGAVRINYTISNPGPFVAFNVYGYCNQSNNGNDMVAWGNALVPPKAVSGYSVYRSALPPVAAFSANVTGGTVPLAVQFTDESTNAPATWAWDFENDGIIDSTEQNPVHTYSTAGTYTVSLTAANAGGSNGTKKAGYVMANAPAAVRVAAFSADITRGAAPLTVRFTDKSTNDPTSWLWDFGDGSTSSDRNPVHTFTGAGKFTVSLTATNSTGASTCRKVSAVTATGLFMAYNHLFVAVANDDGVKWDRDGAYYGTGNNNTYYIKAEGGGLNELHITNSNASASDRGQVTETASQSGVFYVSNTGGRGFDNDIVLIASVRGPVPDDFSLHIKTSGYNWTPATPGAYTPAPTTVDYVYVPVGIDETFTKEDLIYGPQTTRPGPSGYQPLYYGQDTANASTAESIMLVDLKAGNIEPGKFYSTSTGYYFNATATTLPVPIDNGNVRVEYTFTNLTTHASFNAYGWVTASNQNEGINWANQGIGDQASGYFVTGIPYTPPVAIPKAAFSTNATSGAAPLAVQFTDGSTNTPTSWAWDFENDGIVDSTEQNPVHIYAAAGTYTVNLTVENGNGAGTLAKADYIVVGAAGTPGASFSANATSGAAPLVVQFTDGSTNAPTSWAWDFENDGTVDSTERNPLHTYVTVGTYTVNLTVKNAAGSTSRVEAGYVTVSALAAPVASFSANATSGTAPLAVQFADTSTGSPTSWAWDFENDGTVDSTERNPVHTYATAGTYTVNLTVKNTAGSTSRVKAGYVTVRVPGAPVAAFSANATSGTVPLAVRFADESTTSPTAWAWEFGDGNTSAERNPVHTYVSAGNFMVNLTVTNGKGSDTLSRADCIAVSPANLARTEGVSFTASPANGVSPLTVKFSDQSAGSPAGWYWEFGDGGTSLLRNPAHAYTAPGTYTVNLTTTNSTGGTRTLSKESLVLVATTAGPLADYNDTYVRVANHDGIRWDENGNGTYYVPAGSVGSGLSVLHVSTDPAVGDGQVTVTKNLSGTLYATSSGTYLDDVVLLLAVNGTIPADFAVRVKAGGYAWTPTGSAPASVNYTYQPSSLNQSFTKDDFFYGPQDWKPAQGSVRYPLFAGEDMNATVNEYRLLFIDTRAGILRDSSLADAGSVRIEYAFTNLSGTAHVSVYGWKSGQGLGWTNALTRFGSSGYTVLPPTVTIPPVAAFSANQTEGLAPFTARFRDASLNVPRSWSWESGDGNTSMAQNPSFTYAAAGTYTVNLTVTNSKGSSSLSREGYIAVSPPLVTTNDFAIAGLVAQMNGTAQAVLVNATNATVNGSSVSVSSGGGAWESLAITFAEAPVLDAGGANWTGNVSSVRAVTVPETVPLPSLGSPNVTLSLELSGVPDPAAGITSIISSDPDASAQSAFTLAASGEGDQIVATAYTVRFEKSGIANAGSGGIIRSANITMAINHTWVAANGGTGSIVVMHRSDDGTITFLPTRYEGIDAWGNDLFTGYSPDGLSTFVLAAVSPLPATPGTPVATSTNVPYSGGSTYTSASDSSSGAVAGSKAATVTVQSTTLPPVMTTAPVPTTRPKVRITTAAPQMAPVGQGESAAESAPLSGSAGGITNSPILLLAETVAAIVLVSVSLAAYLKRRRRRHDPLRWEED